MAAHVRVADKWERRNGIPEADWRQRARRAEAEAALARLVVETRERERDALAARQERRLGAVTDTLSWRLTEPLRRLNARRRARRAEPA
jgi:hypothetical protein